MNARSSVLDRMLPRWRAPLLAHRKRAQVTDQAAQTLEELARDVLERVPVVLGGVTAALQAPVGRCGYHDIPEVSDRAWRFSYMNFEIFCIIDERCERELLNLIVGGPPARSLTAIERSIVTESLSRLLSPKTGPPARLYEEPRRRPDTQAWRCDVELRGQGKESALQLFTASLPPPPIAFVGPNLSDVPMQLRAIFPSVTCSLADVSAWRTGTLLRLRRVDRQVCALLFAGGRRVAVAHVGSQFGDRAIKLIQVHACTQ